MSTLRAETRPEHESLDSSLGPLFDPPTRETLAAFHRALGQIVPPLEEALRRYEWPEELEIDQRLMRTRWLAEDGIELSTDSVSLARPEPAAAWGTLYVMEGSTLGGVGLNRMIQKSGLESRYLEGYGSETGPMWKRYSSILERFVSAEEATLACEAASWTFDRYSRIFKDCETVPQ